MRSTYRWRASSAARAWLCLVLRARHRGCQDADQPTTPAPAHLSFVDGSATLDRESQARTGNRRACRSFPAIACRRPRGRVEVLFPDGSALDVDEFTRPSSCRIDDAAPAGQRADCMLTVAGVSDPADAVRYQIDTPVGLGRDAMARANTASALLDGREARDASWRSSAAIATLATDAARCRPRRRTQRSRAIRLAAQPPADLQLRALRRLRSLGRGAARRAPRLAPRRSTCLAICTSYGGTFDRYGSWDYERAATATSWYPTVAPAGVRTTTATGRLFRAYGWTWIGCDAWAWPTHHYGRWGYRRRPLVLDSGRDAGRRLGLVGVGAGLRQLVPARLRQSAGVRASACRLGNPWAGWAVVPRNRTSATAIASAVHAIAPYRRPAIAGTARRSSAPGARPPIAPPRRGCDGAPRRAASVRDSESPVSRAGVARSAPGRRAGHRSGRRGRRARRRTARARRCRARRGR